MWDPFKESLRDEYFDCPDEVLAFEEAWTSSNRDLVQVSANATTGPSVPQQHVNGVAVVTSGDYVPKRAALADGHSTRKVALGNTLTPVVLTT